MSIQPILEIMRHICSLHEALILLAEQKQKIIIKNQTDELLKINKQENKLIKQIQEAEHQRKLLVAHFLQTNHFPVQYTITVSEFSKYIADATEQNTLLDERQRLLDTVAKLKTLNSTNQMLLAEAIKLIGFSIEVMTLSGDDGIVYQNPTQQSNPIGRSSMFDSKA